jgi:hypothetical protein
MRRAHPSVARALVAGPRVTPLARSVATASDQGVIVPHKRGGAGIVLATRFVHPRIAAPAPVFGGQAAEQG